METKPLSMKIVSRYFLIILALVSCHAPEKTNRKEKVDQVTDAKLPYLTYNRENLFPGDGSLLRAEDGVFLKDGRIVVADQATGLRLIEKDGSNRPFGKFSAAGYQYLPPDHIPGPNGVILERDGLHIIMSDVSDGKIYRINLATEDVEIILDHPFGVNTVYRDRTGALWFTQSTQNKSMKDLLKDMNHPEPQGAVFRMSDLKSKPVKMIDSLYFANGITMDKDESHLYVAETLIDRVHVFKVNVHEGSIDYNGVAARIGSPDNLVMDNKGRLVVASPLYNQVVVIDLDNHQQQILFDGSTPMNSKLSSEWDRRTHLGENRTDLFSPDIFKPLPGLLTGMFFSTDERTLYICNLGNDLLKYEYDED